MPITCPSCQSTDCAKLSMIYDGGIAKAKSTTMKRGMFGSISDTEGHTMTLLAERAAPPKRLKSGCAWTIVMLIGVACLVTPATMVGFAILAGGAVGLHMENKKITAANALALATWERRWMCTRCGTQFEPLAG